MIIIKKYIVLKMLICLLLVYNTSASGQKFLTRQLENDQKRIVNAIKTLILKMERVAEKLEKAGKTKQAKRLKAAIVMIKNKFSKNKKIENL